MQPLASNPESPPPGPTSAQKALAVVAIMLGALGIIGGCCGAASNMASGAISEFQGQLLGAQAGVQGAEQQQELIAATQALVAKWAPFMVIVQLFNLVASGLLIAAGIQVWRAHAKATELTFIACGSSAIVDIAITLLTVLQQLETQELTRLMMPATTDPNLDATMQTGMKFGMMVGGCFAVGWLLAKLSSYVAFSMVMRRTQR